VYKVGEKLYKSIAMEFMKPSFCKRDEFTKGKEKRLKEDQLNPDGLYVVLLDLKSVPGATNNYESAKFPARILRKDKCAKAGLHVIKFSLLDKYQLPIHVTEMQSFDGFVTIADSGLVVIDTLTVEPQDQYPVRLGYFKGFEQLDDNNEDPQNTAAQPITQPTQS
jgi:hypothetical protein